MVVAGAWGGMVNGRQAPATWDERALGLCRPALRLDLACWEFARQMGLWPRIPATTRTKHERTDGRGKLGRRRARCPAAARTMAMVSRAHARVRPHGTARVRLAQASRGSVISQQITGLLSTRGRAAAAAGRGHGAATGRSRRLRGERGGCTLLWGSSAVPRTPLRPCPLQRASHRPWARRRPHLEPARGGRWRAERCAVRRAPSGQREARWDRTRTDTWPSVLAAPCCSPERAGPMAGAHGGSRGLPVNGEEFQGVT